MYTLSSSPWDLLVSCNFLLYDQVSRSLRASTLLLCFAISAPCHEGLAHSRQSRVSGECLEWNKLIFIWNIQAQSVEFTDCYCSYESIKRRYSTHPSTLQPGEVKCFTGALACKSEGRSLSKQSSQPYPSSYGNHVFQDGTSSAT